jgi:hypothetical protein
MQQVFNMGSKNDIKKLHLKRHESTIRLSLRVIGRRNLRGWLRKPFFCSGFCSGYGMALQSEWAEPRDDKWHGENQIRSAHNGLARREVFGKGMIVYEEEIA